jgi:hypothetical protein
MLGSAARSAHMPVRLHHTHSRRNVLPKPLSPVTIERRSAGLKSKIRDGPTSRRDNIRNVPPSSGAASGAGSTWRSREVSSNRSVVTSGLATSDAVSSKSWSSSSRVRRNCLENWLTMDLTLVFSGHCACLISHAASQNAGTRPVPSRCSFLLRTSTYEDCHPHLSVFFS